MHKLIRKYQYAGSIYAADKSANYPSSTTPNTINTGGNFAEYLKNLQMSNQGYLTNMVAQQGSLSASNNEGEGGGDSSGGDGSLGNKVKKNFNFGNGLNLMSGVSSVVSSLIPKTINSKAYDTVDNVLGFASNIPVVGKYATIVKGAMNAINYLGGTDLDKLKSGVDTNDTLARAGGGYDDFLSDWQEASDLSGQRVGMFENASKYNKKIHNAQKDMYAVQRILGQQRMNDMITANQQDRQNEWTMMNMNGGFGNITFGRRGIKITQEMIDNAKRIARKPTIYSIKEVDFTPEVQTFKDGGSINVIPEGSLHARLHHMENAEGLTKKGIPVVSIAEGGELEQQAEIELNEIIFRLEVTQELEKLMEDGSENAAIEAGKLLVKEIFENTDDRTGLLKDLEPEKKEPTTEDIVKNHQVFKNGGIIEQLEKLSPDKLEELQKIIKYLNQ